ncbi:MAG: beta-galactosidase trimerization domain-containing protein, partial [Candidatus Firestonebacteria bacterium]
NTLLYQDVFLKIITEKQIAEKITGGTKILVVPGAVNIPENVAKKIGEFAAEGGTVVIVPNSLMYDEYNRKKDYIKELAGVEILQMTLPRIKVGKEQADTRTRDDGFIQGAISDMELQNVSKTRISTPGKGLFGGETPSFDGLGVVQKIKAGKDAEILGSFEDGSPAIVLNKKGKGKVYYLATSLEKNSLWKFFDYLVKSEKLDRLIQIVDKNGKRINTVESRTIPYGGGYLTYIVNLSGGDIAVKLDTKLPMKKVTELISDETVNPADINVKKSRTVILKVE